MDKSELPEWTQTLSTRLRNCLANTAGALELKGMEKETVRAQASALHLSIDDLGLPLSETVTAGARVRRQRDQSMARRLAFDLMQRQLRSVDEYLPTPSLPVAWPKSSLGRARSAAGPWRPRRCFAPCGRSAQRAPPCGRRARRVARAIG